MRTGYFFIGLLGVLIVTAIFLPTNSLTGHIVKEPTCKEAGCVELCDMDAPTTCKDKGTICCPTLWESGVCEYEVNCEKVREYSLYQSIEQYQDTIKYQPPAVDASAKRFFFPLILTFAIIIYFMVQRKETV